MTACAARQLRPQAAARLPVALATMHLTWGAGFLTSPRRLVPRSRPVRYDLGAGRAPARAGACRVVGHHRGPRRAAPDPARPPARGAPGWRAAARAAGGGLAQDRWTRPRAAAAHGADADGQPELTAVTAGCG